MSDALEELLKTIPIKDSAEDYEKEVELWEQILQTTSATQSNSESTSQ